MAVMPQRFDNRVAQVVAALFGGLLVLIGLSGFVASASPGTATVYLLVGVYTVVRGLGSSLVVVDGSGDYAVDGAHSPLPAV